MRSLPAFARRQLWPTKFVGGLVAPQPVLVRRERNQSQVVCPRRAPGPSILFSFGRSASSGTLRRGSFVGYYATAVVKFLPMVVFIRRSPISHRVTIERRPLIHASRRVAESGIINSYGPEGSSSGLSFLSVNFAHSDKDTWPEALIGSHGWVILNQDPSLEAPVGSRFAAL